MRRYRVRLIATAAVYTVTEVEAVDGNDAREIALDKAKLGNVVWTYDGCDDDTIEAVETIPLKEVTT